MSPIESTGKQTPRYLLHVFAWGSLGVLLVCLCVTAVLFSATYLKKERERAKISSEQLRHAFSFQHRNMAEEMWTESYESIHLRVAGIATQFGNASYALVLTDPRGNCVFSASSNPEEPRQPAPGACKVPVALETRLSKIGAGSLAISSQLEESTGRYLYSTPLTVGANLKGHLHASVSDPYQFQSGRPIPLAINLFLLPILGVTFAWLLWLLVSRRFLLGPYLRKLVDLEKKQALVPRPRGA